nr:hypothetical protein [Tanacetum cinerariifolium]
MTSITAQQTKLDLELVPKENRLDIGKCNGRIPRGLKPKEETFQVVLDALVLTHSKLTKRRDSNLLWNSSEISFKFTPELRIKTLMPFPSEEDTVSFLKEPGHTRVINSLNDVVID